MGARYLAIVSESNSTYDWKYDVGSYGLKMKNSLEGQMVVKRATYVLWNSSVEALGIFISGGYILSCTIVFGFDLLRCAPIM